MSSLCHGGFVINVWPVFLPCLKNANYYCFSYILPKYYYKKVEIMTEIMYCLSYVINVPKTLMKTNVNVC